jgi:hypothetical protein
MPPQTGTEAGPENGTLCTWCGMSSGTGPTCDVCGSPTAGGNILEEDRPLNVPDREPPKIVRLSEGKPLVVPDSSFPLIPCTWCGGLTARGPTCEMCGSPMVGGNMIAMSDGSAEEDDEYTLPKKKEVEPPVAAPKATAPAEPKKRQPEKAKPEAEAKPVAVAKPAPRVEPPKVEPPKPAPRVEPPKAAPRLEPCN